MAEEVLVSVRIDKPRNQDELSKLTAQIVTQKNEVKSLETAIKNLTKAEGDNSALIKSATKNLEIKKQQLNQNVASQKALVNVINAETNSLNALKAQNAILIKQRNQLNTETEEGRTGIQRLNAQIDANNAKIKDNSSALEKQKINVGNYASALSGLSPGLAGFVNGLQSITLAAKAFIATPIGLVLAGIGLALAPLVSFFKDTATGADAAAREAAGFSLVMDVLKDQVNEFGSATADAFDYIKDAFFAANPALQALRIQYNLLAEAGRQYADALDEIQDRQSKFNVESSFIKNDIAELIIQSKDRTKTEKERLDILDQILQKEGELAIQRKADADDELSATLSRNEARLKGAKIIQEDGETQQQFALRAVDLIRESTLDQGDALADLLLKNLQNLADAEAESISILGKAQNKVNELNAKQEEEAKKAADDRQKAREKELKDIIDFNNAVADANAEQFKTNEKFLTDRGKEALLINKENLEQGLIDQQEYETLSNEIELESLESMRSFYEANKVSTIDIDTQIVDAKIKNRERDRLSAEKTALAVEAQEKRQADVKIDTLNRVANALQIFAKGNKAVAILSILVEKAAAIGQIVAGTAVANAKAVAAFPLTLGQPWVGINTAAGAISIAGTVAAAGQQISQIKGFASGGIVGGKGIGVTRSNGDNRLITAKENEIVLTREQRARVGDDTLREAGVPGFATGGIVGGSFETRQASRFADSQLDLKRLGDVVNSVRTVLVLEQFEAKRMQVNKTESQAIVIS